MIASMMPAPELLQVHMLTYRNWTHLQEGSSSERMISLIAHAWAKAVTGRGGTHSGRTWRSGVRAERVARDGGAERRARSFEDEALAKAPRVVQLRQDFHGSYDY